MIGKNELHLNAATVLQALQEYFNKRIVGVKPKVEDIKTTSLGGGMTVFIVTTVTTPPASAEEDQQ